MAHFLCTCILTTALKMIANFINLEIVQYYLKPCLGAAKLSALNTHMIQQFINSLSNGERAELPDNRFHDLRHSFAVNSLQAGDNIKNVQANLGHATSAFTMDVYCHVSKSMSRESAARTQAFYESVKPV